MVACDVLKDARFEPSLLNADDVEQGVVAPPWTFSTQAVDNGALLPSVWVDLL